MMDRDDPLSSWLFVDQLKLNTDDVAQRQAKIHVALDRLSALLDSPPSKRVNLTNAGIWDWQVTGPADDDLARAQELYRRVYETGGTGSTYAQESLLELIALALDPHSVPFWMS